MNNCKITAILALAFLMSANAAEKNADANRETGTANKSEQEARDTGNSAPDSKSAVFGTPVLTVVEQTPLPKVVPSPDSGKRTKKAEEDSNCGIKQWFTDNKDFLAGIASVVSIIALFISIWLVRIAHTGSRKQLQAYLGLDSLSVGHEHALFTVKNYGQTPASEIRVWCGTSKTMLSAAAIREFRENQVERGSLLWPGGTLSRGVDRKDLEFAFFVYGVILYRDVFGKERTTTFQYTVLALDSLRMDAEGNTTD